MKLLNIAFRLVGVVCLVFGLMAMAGALSFISPEAALVIALAPFPVNPEILAAAIAYRNRRMIADDVLPRVGVGQQSYKYWTWDLAEGFTVPNTHVGRTSRPNQVEFSATEQSSTTKDYALDDAIPYADLQNAPAGINPRTRAAEGLMDLILLDREVRTANLVFDGDLYAANRKKPLTGSDQWDNPDSDPIDEIAEALEAPLYRPNRMTIGRAAFAKLARHPKIVKAMHGNAGDSGIATREFLADLFELDQINVGEAFVNQAKKGKAASLAQAWGKHCLLHYTDTLSNPAAGQSRPTFGFTAQWGDRIGGEQEDKNIGMRGGVIVRVGESVDEHIVAADLAFLLQNVVS